MTDNQTPTQAASPFPRSFHVLTKPVGCCCNLQCSYCYYLHKEDLLLGRTGGRMDEGLLEEFIRQYVAGQEIDEVVFNWHGGEPALAGLDFYRKVVELQGRYAGAKRVRNDFQTNGLLLDEAWCEFFKRHGFYVGLSIDGPKHLHDRCRTARGGEPTFDRVLRVARLLQQFEVPFQPLTVVSAANAGHPEEVYRFLTEELGATRLQWLPCTEPKDFCQVAPGHWDTERMPIVGTAAARPARVKGTGPCFRSDADTPNASCSRKTDQSPSVVTEWSVDPDEWGEFLCKTFDMWIANDLGRVFVNWFETLVGLWMNEPSQICNLAPVCGRSLITLEMDGSLYSCDRFVYPEYRLGWLAGKETGPCFRPDASSPNISSSRKMDQSPAETRLAEVAYSPRQRAFGMSKRDSLTDECRRCQFSFACNGECPKNRFVKSPDGQPGHNYLCPGLNRFFTHADPTLRQLATQVLSRRMSQISVASAQTVVTG